MGTPQYMSPEQITAPGEVDHRADIYALGVVFYQMLTGELPGKKIAPPSTKVQMDVRLDEIVLRALEKNPKLRYQQVSEVKTCVETIASSNPAERSESLRTEFSLPPRTQFSSLLFPLLAFGVVYLGLLAFMAWSYPQFPERMASHFDAEGHANGWMARPYYFLLLGSLPLFFGGLFWLIARAAEQFPALVKIPNRNFWLAPGRRAETAGRVLGQLLWLAVLLTLFFTVVHALTWRANLAVQQHLPAGGLLILVMGFFTVLIIWLINFVNQFADTTKSVTMPQQQLILRSLESWLALMDGGNYAQSWDAAAKFFQKAIAKEEWIERLGSVRHPQGRVLSRKLRTARRFGSRFTAKFDTAFAGLKAAVETVTFSRERDGQWRAIGYLILPAYAEKAYGFKRRLRKFFLVQFPAVIVIALVIRAFFLQPFRAETEAAAPEIPRGSHFLVWKLAHPFTLGDLIAYRRDGWVSVGRVVSNEPGALSVNRNGEANAVVPPRDILGKVISIYWRGTPQPESELIESFKSNYIGQTSFPFGDSIEITSVVRSNDRLMAKGHYQLVSRDQATLALYLTTRSTNAAPTDSRQTLQISKGSGDFELVHTHLVPGLPHVSMYADGRPFAGIYFGNKDEAVVESKLDLGDYQTPNDMSEGTLSFGPVVERSLKIEGHECDFLNFRSGEVFRRPYVETDVTDSSPPTEFITWVRKNGMDVGFCGSNNGFDGPAGILTFDMGTFAFNSNTIPANRIPRFHSVEEWQTYNVQNGQHVTNPLIGSLAGVTNIWDDLTANQLEEPTNGCPAYFLGIKLFAKRYRYAPTNLPGPIAFSTRDGTDGILQITGFTENPRGVKLRYKLVQPSTRTNKSNDVIRSENGNQLISSAKSREDLLIRLKAAESISELETKSDVLFSLVREAIKSNELDLAKQAASEINVVETSDQAIRDIAFAFKQNGQLREAIKMAETMSIVEEHDKTLLELSK